MGRPASRSGLPGMGYISKPRVAQRTLGNRPTRSRTLKEFDRRSLMTRAIRRFVDRQRNADSRARDGSSGRILAFRSARYEFSPPCQMESLEMPSVRWVARCACDSESAPLSHCSAGSSMIPTTTTSVGKVDFLLSGVALCHRERSRRLLLRKVSDSSLGTRGTCSFIIRK